MWLDAQGMPHQEPNLSLRVYGLPVQVKNVRISARIEKDLDAVVLTGWGITEE
jgi:hypothetical protein